MRPNAVFSGLRAVKTPAKSWDEIVDVLGISDARVQIVEAAGFPEADFIRVILGSRRDTAGHGGTPGTPIALKPIRRPQPRNAARLPREIFSNTSPKTQVKLKPMHSLAPATEYLSFDILGRVTRSRQTTDGVEYGGGSDPSRWMTYTYNFSGALIEQQYPSGRVVRNVLDNDGSLSMVLSKRNASFDYHA